MAKTKIKVPVEIYDELFRLLEAGGVQLKPDDDLIITKDIKMEMPGVNYKQVQIRRDIMEIASKVYNAPVNDAGFEVSNSHHFMNFIDDAYNYVLKGTKPQATTIATPETDKKWK